MTESYEKVVTAIPAFPWREITKMLVIKQPGSELK
jgi:hypothetical protein